MTGGIAPRGFAIRRRLGGMFRSSRPVRILSAVLLGAVLCAVGTPGADARPLRDAAVPHEEQHWIWPVEGPRVVLDPFRAPEHSWSAGHRGVDVAARPEAEVRAPASGTVAFRGVVVDRPLITIAHPGGLVTTLEPVLSDLSPGDRVAAGEVVGTVATGGHTPRGALHVGVRWHGAYINPLLLFGGVPRAVLLPCCD